VRDTRADAAVARNDYGVVRTGHYHFKVVYCRVLGRKAPSEHLPAIRSQHIPAVGSSAAAGFLTVDHGEIRGQIRHGIRIRIREQAQQDPLLL
jgi:hypothetical protein